MKVRQYPTMRSTLLACCLAAALTAAHASETGTTTTTTTSGTSTTTTAVGTSATTEARLSSEFAGFLGGEAQAGAVVSGLRQGTAFNLESGSGGSGTTTVDPPTGTMGYGNVRIALRLAQAELGQLGITQPTSAELSAVLLGGDINGTQVNGILSLRAEGMGWGQIARQYGTTVGQLMGQGAGLSRQAATSSRTHLPGKASGTSTSQARANGYIPSGGGSAHGSGMVTASGDSVGGAAYGGGKGPANRSAGRSQDAGVVSAGGQHVSLSGVGNAGGGSRAQAPGQARNN